MGLAQFDRASGSLETKYTTVKGAKANILYLTIVEMAKNYNLNLYEYLKFLFDHRPSKGMTDDELENLAPWNEHVQELCK